MLKVKTIIKSLVNDIIMPPIGKMLGNVDFTELSYVIQLEVVESADGVGDGNAEVANNYGLFINAIITFLIVAFSIFMVVKAYNKMKAKLEKVEEEAPASPPEPSKEEILLTEIRDLLKK